MSVNKYLDETFTLTGSPERACIPEVPGTVFSHIVEGSAPSPYWLYGLEGGGVLIW